MLQTNSAIDYNKACNYSQQAIGIIQMFVNAPTKGYFEEKTVEAVYRMQQSPMYGFPAGSADGKVGPKTLGVMIMELEHVSRMTEAAVLRSYCYRINGETFNTHKKPHVYEPPSSTGDDDIIILEDEPIEPPLSHKEKDFPRDVYKNELRHIWSGPGTIPNPGSGPSLEVGRYYLATKDIRKILGLGGNDIYYIVVQTASPALDPFLVGKIYKQTKRGFWADLQSAALSEVGRNARGGQEMMKKEVELIIGAACAAAGGLAAGGGLAASGIASLTAMSMNILLMNSKELFTAGNAIQELLKVSDVLSQHTPEFWLLCKTVLKLGALNAPQTVLNDPYAGVKLAGELVIIVGEAVLLRQFKSFGWMLKIIIKLMQTAFNKLVDATTIAIHGKDLIAEMKKLDPTINDVSAARIIAELKTKWHIVGPAINSLKAVADQLVGA